MYFHPSYFATSLKFFLWQNWNRSLAVASHREFWGSRQPTMAGRWPFAPQQVSGQHSMAVLWNKETHVKQWQLCPYWYCPAQSPQCASPQLSTSMLRSEARKARLFNMLVLTPVPVYFIPSITYFKASSFLQVQWRQGNWYFWRILHF